MTRNELIAQSHAQGKAKDFKGLLETGRLMTQRTDNRRAKLKSGKLMRGGNADV
jgi:hypothetical protein